MSKFDSSNYGNNQYRPDALAESGSHSTAPMLSIYDAYDVPSFSHKNQQTEGSMNSWINPAETTLLGGRGDYETGQNAQQGKFILDNMVSPLYPSPVQDAIKAVQDSLVMGNAKSFGETVQALQGDPAMLNQILQQVDTNLTAAGSSLHVASDQQGNIFLGNNDNIVMELKTDGSMQTYKWQPNGDGSRTLDGPTTGQVSFQREMDSYYVKTGAEIVKKGNRSTNPLNIFTQELD